MTARNFGLYYNSWPLHLSIKTPQRTSWMKLWQKEPPMEYLQGAPYTSTLTGKKERRNAPSWYSPIGFWKWNSWWRTNGEKKRKEKKKKTELCLWENYFEELRTVEDHINQILCNQESQMRIKIFRQEKKHNAYIIVLLNAHILICP